MKELLEKYGDWLFTVSRVLFGFLFYMHGAQKLFGIFGGSKVELVSLLGLAGVIEFSVGAALVFGLFTRVFSIVGILEMLFAYFTAHLPSGGNPLGNDGELALLYFAAFLIFAVVGAKKLSLERAIWKKEFV